MKISVRNILTGKVSQIVKGAVNSEVDLTLTGGQSIAAIITNPSAESLGLKEGGIAYAIIKANEVIVGKDLGSAKLSARNVFGGTVTRVEEGAVNSEVVITLAGGTEIVASITRKSVQNLGLVAGDTVSAIVKASNVLLGV